MSLGQRMIPTNIVFSIAYVFKNIKSEKCGK